MRSERAFRRCDLEGKVAKRSRGRYRKKVKIIILGQRVEGWWGLHPARLNERKKKGGGRGEIRKTPPLHREREEEEAASSGGGETKVLLVFTGRNKGM